MPQAKTRQGKESKRTTSTWIQGIEDASRYSPRHKRDALDGNTPFRKRALLSPDGKNLMLGIRWFM